MAGIGLSHFRCRANGYRKPDGGGGAHARSHGDGARIGRRKRRDPLHAWENSSRRRQTLARF
jgi:hypothetical protein